MPLPFVIAGTIPPRRYGRRASIILAVLGLCITPLFHLWAGEPNADRAGTAVKVEPTEYPWSAIGRLNLPNFSVRGHCSATLIGPATILTAAHCLWNSRTQTWRPTADLHFVAGPQDSEHPLHSLIKRYVVADGFHPQAAHTVGAESSDWAVAELDEPVGRSAGWLPLGNGAPPDGKPLLVEAGYRRENPYVITLAIDCRPTRAEQGGGLLWHDCQASPGASGGPLLSFKGGTPRIVAITVAATANETPPRTLAISVAAMRDAARFPSLARTIQALAEGDGGKPNGDIDPSPTATVHRLAPTWNGKTDLAALTEVLRRVAQPVR